MFGAFAVGLTLLVTGAIGYDVRYMHGFFQGGRWVEAPIAWQIAAGIGLVLLGVYWFRRLGEAGGLSSPDSRHRVIKTIGRGKTAAAAEQERRTPHQ
jgi:hypothetical protein